MSAIEAEPKVDAGKFNEKEYARFDQRLKDQLQKQQEAKRGA